MAAAVHDSSQLSRAQRLTLRVQGIDDPRIKLQLLLEPIVNTVSNRLRREINEMYRFIHVVI